MQEIAQQSHMTHSKTANYLALLIIFSIAFSFSSCSEQAEIKMHLKDIGIKLNDKIIVNKFQPSGFTNFVLTIELEVSEQDKQSIIHLFKRIKTSTRIFLLLVIPVTTGLKAPLTIAPTF